MGESEKSVYIAGIPYSVDEEKLREFLVEQSELKDDSILDVRMPRYHDSNKPRGYAHVDLKTDEDLEIVLKLDNETLGGRYLRISKANARGSKGSSKPKGEVPAGCTTLFVKNLPYDTDEDSVEEVFVRFGNVTNVRLARWNHTGKLKGFGYIEFDGEEGVKKAANHEESIYVGDRVVVLDFEASGSGPKASFRNSSGRQWSRFEGRDMKKRKPERGDGPRSRKR